MPLGAAEPGRLLGEVQSLQIYAQRFTRPLLIVNVSDQVDATHDLAIGVADRSAADTDPGFSPIAPVIKDLSAGHDFPLKRPRQHGFTTLDRPPVYFISEPFPIRFDVRRQNHRVAENLLHLWIEHDDPPSRRFGQYDAGRNVLDDGFQPRSFSFKLRHQPLVLRPCPLAFSDLRLQFNLPLYGVPRLVL